MQQVVYLIVALAVAAAILSLAAAMKAVLPPPEAPLNHAEALVYVKVKPLNGSYWLGVYAPYGDVIVRQVRINNAVYSLGVTAPVGRDVWLNASGRPLTVRCNSTVELVTAKGVATRPLVFTVQCPTVRQQDINITQLKVLERYAYNVAKYVLGFNETKITIRVRELGYVEVVNISPDPLILVFDQASIPFNNNVLFASKTAYFSLIDWKREYLIYRDVTPLGNVYYYEGSGKFYSALGVPTWVQHIYLPPNGSVRLYIDNGALKTLISVYPAQYYYYNPANTTVMNSYLATISPWRVINIKVYKNSTTAVVEYLNESGIPQIASKRIGDPYSRIYKAYGGITFYIDTVGRLVISFPVYSTCSVGSVTFFCGTTWVPILVYPNGTFTYYVSNTLHAYNYVLEAISNFPCNGGGTTSATLYKLDRYDWSKRVKVADASYSVPCPSSGGGDISVGGGSSSYTCYGTFKQYVNSSDVKLANATQDSYTYCYKWHYVLKDCNGTIVERGYDIVCVTVKKYGPYVFVRDAEDASKICTYNNATSCTMRSGQVVLTCKNCPQS